ncbi:hypothetical protein CLAIMM_04255 [Cladophialophora immunda]|nr:hypothetical protein CLAIMM_04255 [Cladophialophora immunda]
MPGNTGDMGSSNLALVFLRHGIRGVLAMRYELKAAAAPIITKTFYRALCIEGKSFIESAGAAREALMQNRRRRAKYAEAVEIQDYCVPATYCLSEGHSGPVSLLPESHLSAPTVTAPVLFGRDSDVERLEVMLVKPDRAMFVILKGTVGIGKTQMLRHLKWWWSRSGLFDCVVYVNTRLVEGGSTASESCAVGLAALVEGIAWVLGAEGVLVPTKCPVENLNALGEWIETTGRQSAVLLLDGIDELYRMGCKTTDTQEKWHEFLRAAQNLSGKVTIVMAMTKTDYLVPKELNTCVFPLQAAMLPSAAADLILHYSGTRLDLSEAGNEPERDLKNALSALSCNPTAIQCHKNDLAKPFCGLGKILDWSDRNSDTRISPYLWESARADMIIWRVIHGMSGQGQVLDIFGLLLLGFFTCVIPEVESLEPLIVDFDEFRNSEEFEEYFEQFEKVEQFEELFEISEMLVGNVRHCGIPLELWDFMHHRRPTQSNSLATAISNALDLLRAAGLVDIEIGPVMGGQRYHVINPCATQSLRDSLTFLVPPYPLFVMLEIFKSYQAGRSDKMLWLTKDMSVRAGLREYAPLVLTERFTLLSVILHYLNDQLSPDPVSWSQIPIETLRVVWPSSMGDDRLCPELLGSTMLKWIRKFKDSEFSEAQIEWPDCQNKLWLLNWAVDYTIRYNHPSDLAFVLPLREAVRKRQAQSRLEHGVKNSAWPERKALWTNFGLAVAAGDAARMAAVSQAIMQDRLLSDDDWGWLGRVVDVNTAALEAIPFRPDISKAPNLETVLQGLSLARERTASTSTNPEQEWAISSTLRQNVAMVESIDRQSQTAEQYIKLYCATALRDKFLDGLLTSLPPGYIARGSRFIDYLGRGDLSRAKQTAYKAFEEAVEEQQAHIAATWRGVCEEMERLDAEEESHEGLRQVILEYLNRTPGTELSRAVVTEDYAAAYELVEATLAVAEMTKPRGEEVRMLRETAKVLDQGRANGGKEKAKWWDVLFRLFRIGRDVKVSAEKGEPS